MTVFDPSTLHQLVDDAEGRPFLLELAGTYRRMLMPRVERVVTAVVTSDYDEAMDAVLSLKVSATMTGTRELAELASYIEVDIRSGDLPAARSQAMMLPAAAQRAQEAIASYLAMSAAPSIPA
ncbi:Hpt domain-containing protein [Nocardioides sp.]|uniref:Hpt domain-containing protein n=1 Tax=Nocardioides sp. TaxID=35761 RepID=UPI00272576E6|nr:Hpt domain-containing protein [Nocardioides sp.]MDO9458427.1 Hpt domain-containing protein [Nocardioides sp.]